MKSRLFDGPVTGRKGNVNFNAQTPCDLPEVTMKLVAFMIIPAGNTIVMVGTFVPASTDGTLWGLREKVV